LLVSGSESPAQERGQQAGRMELAFSINGLADVLSGLTL
jgi:hypothetical protein